MSTTWKNYKSIKAEQVERDRIEDAKPGAEAKNKIKQKGASAYSIDPARVKRLFVALNKDAIEELSKVRERNKQPANVIAPPVASTPDAPKKVHPIQRKYSNEDQAIIDACNFVRIRYSRATLVQLCNFCEEIVNDIVHVATFSALEQRKNTKKSVRVANIFSDKLESARFKKLFTGLPSFIAMREQIEKERYKQAIASEVKECMAEFGHIKGVSDKRQEILKRYQPEAPSTSEKEKRETVEFERFICKIIKAITGSEPTFAGTVAYSVNFKLFVHSLLTEFILSVAMCAVIEVETTKRRTVSPQMINSIILSMLATPGAVAERKAIIVPKAKEQSKCIMPEYVNFVNSLYPVPIPVVVNPCGAKDCPKRATYGKQGETVAKFCSAHKTDDMIKIVKAKVEPAKVEPVKVEPVKGKEPIKEEPPKAKATKKNK